METKLLLLKTLYESLIFKRKELLKLEKKLRNYFLLVILFFGLFSGLLVGALWINGILFAVLIVLGIFVLFKGGFFSELSYIYKKTIEVYEIILSLEKEIGEIEKLKNLSV